MAGGAELLDIRAVEIRSSLNAEAEGGSPYDVNVSIEPSFFTQPADEDDPAAGVLLLYSLWYDISLRPVGSEMTIADVGCRYNAAYHWSDADTPSDEELRAFGETTVLLALYPYVRQLVHDITGRFNLDPLVMPLYKEPLKPPAAAKDPDVSDARKKVAIAKKAAKRTAGPKKSGPATRKTPPSAT